MLLIFQADLIACGPKSFDAKRISSNSEALNYLGRESKQAGRAIGWAVQLF